jgi:hypothetical protein
LNAFNKSLDWNIEQEGSAQNETVNLEDLHDYFMLNRRMLLIMKRQHTDMESQLLIADFGFFFIKWIHVV